MHRRRFLGLVPGVLLAAGKINKDDLGKAEELLGLHFDDAQRAQIAEVFDDRREQIEQLHAQRLENSLAPALRFDPLPSGWKPRRGSARARASIREERVDLPESAEGVAFLSVVQLGSLIRRKKISPSELTALYLDRLKKADAKLSCVISLTEERALKQARVLDDEVARGRVRGPLHGIPWGAKDLLAVKGFPTTWGAGPYKTQVIDEDATVVQRLDAAGAVLIAKLALGELAMGDHWFGGITKNPWNPEDGSSGSSAGPAAATAAGLVGFSVGSETLGSISSPCTRCGATGLRPTFGRIPRTGAMALSWSMDKLGPICRTADDCALVFAAIAGPDGRDVDVREAPFSFSPQDLRKLRIGYLKKGFDEAFEPAKDDKPAKHASKELDDAALEVLKGLGARVEEVDLPEIPWTSMRPILTTEAAAAFDELTRSGRDKELVQQGKDDWANTFRAMRFFPAVDYVNANRLRALAIREMDARLRGFDAVITPTRAPGQLLATNLAGYPAVILPHGFRPHEKTGKKVPDSITFIGALDGEDRLLAVARAYQRATKFHLEHPDLA